MHYKTPTLDYHIFTQNSNFIYRTQQKILKMRFLISFLLFAFTNQIMLLMESYIEYTPNQTNGRLFDTIITGGDSGVFASKNPQVLFGGVFF